MFDSQNIIDELKNQGIEPDSSQIELIRKLCRIRFNKNNFLNLKFFKNTSCSGIYIWGEVGRGKTLITNAFLKKCTSIKFKSFHYIDLMKFNVAVLLPCGVLGVAVRGARGECL